MAASDVNRHGDREFLRTMKYLISNVATRRPWFCTSDSHVRTIKVYVNISQIGSGHLDVYIDDVVTAFHDAIRIPRDHLTYSLHSPDIITHPRQSYRNKIGQRHLYTTIIS